MTVQYISMTATPWVMHFWWDVDAYVSHRVVVRDVKKERHCELLLESCNLDLCRAC